MYIHLQTPIPELWAEQRTKTGNLGGETRELQTNLFRLFNPDRFTLFYANLTSPEKTHKLVQSLLSPWKHLVHGYQVSAARESERPFGRLFGTAPAILLVRPDSYVAFTGSEHSVPALAKYLEQWFSTQPQSADRENGHARTHGLLERPLASFGKRALR